ncbi:MAG TPA: hypothetical protein VFZ96_00645 [Actinomycetota bacterium]|nr:hypothetical protein [Actinomycetota bacterium]
MEPERAEEQIRELRKARDRGLGEEGRTKEEQDRAMMGDGAPAEERPGTSAEEPGASTSEEEDGRPER